MKILNFLVSFLIVIVGSILINIIYSRINKGVIKAEKNMDENHFVIHKSKFNMWLLTICMILLGVCSILFLTDPNYTTMWWVLIAVLCFLLAAFIVLYFTLWEIRVNGNEIRYTTLLRRPKTFTFASVKKVKIKDKSLYRSITFYSGTKKLLSIDSSCKGYNIFMARLRQEPVEFFKALTPIINR
ncbi:MAG: hypothetical protein FWD71_01545 [Oscillospiraceae bacterium]|nr:hypothetical protein [Oscillospiraceae bacterium]